MNQYLTDDERATMRQVAEAATGGSWHWAGNIDTGEPYLATWISGAGRCQILSIGSENRSTSGPRADRVRADAREFSLGDPEELVRRWAFDQFDQPVTDPRLQFLSDLMMVDARDRVVFEVAPQATSREDPSVYRADIVGIRHPDAEHLVTASPKAVLALLAERDYLAERSDVPDPCVLTHTEPYDFAQCETHDTTFALGDTCKFDGADSIAGVFDEEAREQRGRAVMAEIRAERAKSELDAMTTALRALAETWEGKATSAEASLAAPEGILDYAATMRRRAADLRAILDSTDDLAA